MELIVKIGADQQQLQQTVGRMTQQFKTMNISTPAAWGGQSSAAAWNAAAKGGADGSSLEDSLTSNSAIKRIFGYSMKGGAVVAAMAGLKELFDYGTKNLSQDFWERTYGVNDKLLARVNKVYADLRKSVQETIKLRAKDQEDLDKKTFEGATDQGKRIVLEKRLKEAEAKVKAAADELTYRQQNVNEARGLGGAALTPEQRAKLTRESSEAEQKLHKARMELRDTERDYRNILDKITEQGIKETRDKDEEFRKARAKELEGADELRRKSGFEVDALTKAGLFAGSSLNMNQDFSIQREQLAALLRIEARMQNSDFS